MGMTRIIVGIFVIECLKYRYDFSDCEGEKQSE